MIVVKVFLGLFKLELYYDSVLDLCWVYCFGRLLTTNWEVIQLNCSLLINCLIILYRCSMKVNLYMLLLCIISNVLFYMLMMLMYLLCWRMCKISNVFNLMLMLVSGYVLVYSLNYMSMYDYAEFFMLLLLFCLCMYILLLVNDLIMCILSWEYIGMLSYCLMNFWCNKNQCGIKAVVYNKLGDCFLLLFCMIYFSVCYCFDLELSIYFMYHFSLFYFIVLLICCYIALCTKSAQLPFCSWLIYAIPAPTPISALLHSSTMVIAGIYLSFIVCFNLNSCYLCYGCLSLMLVYSSISLLWSVFLTLFIVDMKSIIAYSTISQIGYMLLGSLIIPSLSLYHIIVHALFKSLLFLCSAEIIHNSQANWQSIYILKLKTVIENSFFRAYLIFGFMCFMFCVSKEGLLKILMTLIDSKFIFISNSLGALGTTFYTTLLIAFSGRLLSVSTILWKPFATTTLIVHDNRSFIISSYFVTLAITALIVDKLFFDIFLNMFIVYPYCFPYFNFSLTLSFNIFFILFFSLFYKSWNSILVSLPWASISPFLLNWIPFMHSFYLFVVCIIETFGHIGLNVTINATFILSCFSLNSILLSFLSLSGFIS